MSLLRVLAVVVLGCSLLVTSRAAAWDAGYGRAWRGDGVLHPGCHRYRFHYRVRPRDHDWTLELFLRGPGGRRLGNTALDSDVDPRRGRGVFRVCRETTRPGRYRIRGKLTLYDDGGLPFLSSPEQPDVTWIRPARFRLRRSG